MPAQIDFNIMQCAKWFREVTVLDVTFLWMCVNLTDADRQSGRIRDFSGLTRPFPLCYPLPHNLTTNGNDGDMPADQPGAQRVARTLQAPSPVPAGDTPEPGGERNFPVASLGCARYSARPSAGGRQEAGGRE